MENLNNTQYFTVQKEPELQVRDVLEIVFRALSEKGYNPVDCPYLVKLPVELDPRR